MSSSAGKWWNTTDGQRRYSVTATTSSASLDTVKRNVSTRRESAAYHFQSPGLSGLSDPSPPSFTYGVYTRISTKKRKKLKYTKRGSSLHWAIGKFICSICNSRKLCLCQECVISEVHFYEKRVLQKDKEKRWQLRKAEIENSLKDEVVLEDEFQQSAGNVIQLKMKIEELKKRNELKRNKIKEYQNSIARHTKIVNDLKEKFKSHEEIFAAPFHDKNELQMVLDKVAKRRKKSAQMLCEIFTIKMIEEEDSMPFENEAQRRVREQIADACSTAVDAKDKSWTMIGLTEREELKREHSVRFSICGCVVNDCSEYHLKEWFETGIPKSYEARGIHNTFAALTYCVQFVNSLIRLFDLCMPTQVRITDFAAYDKHSVNLFDTDIFKLNLAIIIICLSQGVPQCFLEPHRPFANLLCFSKFVVEVEKLSKPESFGLTDDLAAAIENDLRKISWAERERVEEDDWCLIHDSETLSCEPYFEMKPLSSTIDLQQVLKNFNFSMKTV